VKHKQKGGGTWQKKQTECGQRMIERHQKNTKEAEQWSIAKDKSGKCNSWTF
jgi:hypothetical protein